MKWLEIFKLYSLKELRKNKLLISFTFLTILIATTISVIIPIVNLENHNYFMKNIKKSNGGELFISAYDSSYSLDFKKKLEELKIEGAEIKESIMNGCYYKKDSNKFSGTIFYGDYGLKEDEIILQKSLAKKLNLSLGDEVEIESNGNGVLTYKIKELEDIPSAVNEDSELLGYGKVKAIDSLDKLIGDKFIVIDKIHGEQVKNQLKEIENSYYYRTIKDKEYEFKDKLFLEKTSLSILTVISYIFAILSMVTTVIMIILKRKKDIAIFDVLAIDKTIIKKVFFLEFSLCFFLPIIISNFFIFIGAKIILKEIIGVATLSLESLKIMGKGFIFNSFLFFLLMIILLKLLDVIKGMSILREEKEELNKTMKKIIITLNLFVLGALILYSVFFNAIENLFSILLIFVVVLLFLIVIKISIKLLLTGKCKNNLLLYSLSSIKKNNFSFLFLILSLSLTLWTTLIAFTLEGLLKENFKNSFDNALPYNYYVETKDEKQLENLLKNDKDIKGYIKSFSIVGKIKNEKFNDFSRTIYLEEIEESDYKLAFNIIEGKNLFTGEEGILISDKFKSLSDLKLGDQLIIETENGIVKEVIKGIYESGGINTSSILKEKKEFAEKECYFIKAEKGEFTSKITNSMIRSIDELGESLTANILKFLKVFRILSMVALVGTIIFNVNMNFINSFMEEKEGEIILALGYEKRFLIKTLIIKAIILIFLSTLVAISIYSLIIKSFFKLMINFNAIIPLEIISFTILLAIIITGISFFIPINNIRKKKELFLLREN